MANILTISGSPSPSSRTSAVLDAVRRLINRVIPWLLPIFLIAVRQGLSTVGVLSTKILPAPTDVLRAAWQLIQTGELVHHIAVSFQRAVVGLVIGGSMGLCWDW